MSLEKVGLPMMRKLENLFFVKMCLFEALKHWNMDMQFSRYWLRERKKLFSGKSLLLIAVKIHPDLPTFGRMQLSVLSILWQLFQNILCILGNVFSCLCKVPFSSALQGWEMQELKMPMQPYSDVLERMCYDIDFNWNDCIHFSSSVTCCLVLSDLEKSQEKCSKE